MTEDGTPRRLAELRRDARPLLVDLSGDVELSKTLSPWSGRVDRVAARSGQPMAPSLLVRPDGYVAWSGVGPDGLGEALGRWFGAPDDAGSPLPVV